jgi:acyl-coenzyme A synthetase/AMP-(fatty) acid ligase
VAGGYLHNAQLTEQLFLPDPFNPKGGTMYKTGDLVCWLPDGQMQYVGRRDFQVKLRGMRVELGEVENAILQQTVEGVTACAVMAHNDALYAFVVFQATEVDFIKAVTGLHSALTTSLPNFMVPSKNCIIALSKLPLTANGKLDRRALLVAVENSATNADNPNDGTDLTSLESELIGK